MWEKHGKLGVMSELVVVSVFKKNLALDPSSLPLVLPPRPEMDPHWEELDPWLEKLNILEEMISVLRSFGDTIKQLYWESITTWTVTKDKKESTWSTQYIKLVWECHHMRSGSTGSSPGLPPHLAMTIRQEGEVTWMHTYFLSYPWSCQQSMKKTYSTWEFPVYAVLIETVSLITQADFHTVNCKSSPKTICSGRASWLPHP